MRTPLLPTKRPWTVPPQILADTIYIFAPSENRPLSIKVRPLWRDYRPGLCHEQIHHLEQLEKDPRVQSKTSGASWISGFDKGFLSWVSLTLKPLSCPICPILKELVELYHGADNVPESSKFNYREKVIVNKQVPWSTLNLRADLGNASSVAQVYPTAGPPRFRPPPERRKSVPRLLLLMQLLPPKQRHRGQKDIV